MQIQDKIRFLQELEMLLLKYEASIDTILPRSFGEVAIEVSIFQDKIDHEIFDNAYHLTPLVISKAVKKLAEQSVNERIKTNPSTG